MRSTSRLLRHICYGGFFVALLIAAVTLSIFLSTSATATHIVAQAGYGGLLILGIIGGFNVLVPIPAAVFAELYTAAGLSTLGIIITLAVGTLIADLLGFWFGRLLRTATTKKYPHIVTFVTKMREDYTYLVLPFVGMYAAIVPFPNEAILIPLAISGIKIRYLLIPLMVGNLIHQTVIIYGINGVLVLLGF